MYYHFNWTQTLLMNGIVGFILPTAYYLLGEKLAGVIWGELLMRGHFTQKHIIKFQLLIKLRNISRHFPA
jgi:hypothetical protein